MCDKAERQSWSVYLRCSFSTGFRRERKRQNEKPIGERSIISRMRYLNGSNVCKKITRTNHNKYHIRCDNIVSTYYILVVVFQYFSANLFLFLSSIIYGLSVFRFANPIIILRDLAKTQTVITIDLTAAGAAAACDKPKKVLWKKELFHFVYTMIFDSMHHDLNRRLIKIFIYII